MLHTVTGHYLFQPTVQAKTVMCKTVKILSSEAKRDMAVTAFFGVFVDAVTGNLNKMMDN